MGHDQWDIYERADHVGGLASSYHRRARLHLGPRRPRDVQPLHLLRRPRREDAARRLRPAHARGVGVDVRPVRAVPVPEQHPPPAARRLPRVRHGDHRVAEGDVASASNFAQWINAIFGDGIARHFMLPYNFKVWAHPLEMMVDDVAGRPGARRRRRNGSCRTCSTTATTCAGDRTTCSSSRCSAPGCCTTGWPRRCRSRSTSNVRRSPSTSPPRWSRSPTDPTAGYDKLVTTMPLKELVKCIPDCPPEVHRRGR